MVKVLFFLDWYFPGYKAGGPIQSARNLINLLSGEVDFFVCTSDRDLGESHPYNTVSLNEWNNGPYGEKVYYSTSSQLNFSRIKELIGNVQPDVVYFNSMFSYRYTLLPLLYLRRSGYKGKVLLAPRGMLHQGAISITSPAKQGKKKLFLYIFRLFEFHRFVHFHATNDLERADICRYFPRVQPTEIGNVPNVNRLEISQRQKTPGKLDLVFISRLHPKKNILYFIELLVCFQGTGEIKLDIFGGDEDKEYLNACQQAGKMLPGNITINFKGPLANELIFTTISAYHAFVLPTLGENFGHAIFEALTCGVPVLISDQTPWTSLSLHKAGWDIPLKNMEEYLAVITQLLGMEQEEYYKWQIGARAYSLDYLKRSNLHQKYLQLFNE